MAPNTLVGHTVGHPPTTGGHGHSGIQWHLTPCGGKPYGHSGIQWYDTLRDTLWDTLPLQGAMGTMAYSGT